MTSEEIKQKQAIDLSTNGWLREICLQLAQLNEKKPTEQKLETYGNNRSGHTKQRS